MRNGRAGRAGFSLVELMVAVAIIGVLAALAIYGVQHYLGTARSSEAKEKVGAITRSAASAYERENSSTETLPEGNNSGTASHVLCDSAVAVPGSVPSGRKYQPNTAAGADFNSGSASAGWLCLRFAISQPHYYQYHYNRDATVAAPNNPASCSSDCFEAGAVGDIDGDGVFSRFARTGSINTSTGSLKTQAQIFIEEENE